MRRWQQVIGGVAVLILMWWSNPALALPPLQSAIRLAYDSVAYGAISDARSRVSYEFEGVAGDVIAIEMTTIDGDLDPLVELLAPDGTLLIANDDVSDDNLNARIQYTLPQTGLFRVIATRFGYEDGGSRGSYSLLITRLDSSKSGDEARPVLDVPYDLIGYNETVSSELAESGARYYLFAGDAGDVVVAILTPSVPELQAGVRFYDLALNQLSETVLHEEDTGGTAYYVLPESGQYLIRVASQSGSGRYELETVGFAAQWIAYGDSVSGTVMPDAPNVWYVFNAQYGDTVTVEQTVLDGDLVPYTILADGNLNDLAYTVVGDNPAVLTYTIPANGQYVLLASREGLRNGETTGSFALRLNGLRFDPESMTPVSLGYGRSAEGVITDAEPVAVYRFQGKAHDLVTITMQAVDRQSLDPYLMLMDETFNILSSNDNTRVTSNARIFQYELPASGLYYIMASRRGLAAGASTGEFTVELLEGEVTYTAGAVEATLRWNHEADLDLFVRDPEGALVGWENEGVPSGGVLEVDTNADCETVTALPVEHVYWPQDTNLPGVYEFMVWYQLDCENRGPVRFDLSILVGGEQIDRVNGMLERGERYEMSITVGDDGSAFSNDDGQIVTGEDG